jgi:F-type H+-transporting ATPase subunit delta
MTEISKEYGTALFMLACEEGETRKYAAALEQIKEIFSAYPQYVEMLASPSISLNERLSAIDAAFSDAAPEYVLSYLKLLCEKGRISCFVESVEEYLALLAASERVSNAKVTSAVALTDEEKQKLIAKLEEVNRGKVHAEYFVDASLLGGAIVEMDGKIMDGSLRHRLYDVKEVILHEHKTGRNQ